MKTSRLGIGKFQMNLTFSLPLCSFIFCLVINVLFNAWVVESKIVDYWNAAIL
jgi:hypothetical protein